MISRLMGKHGCFLTFILLGTRISPIPRATKIRTVIPYIIIELLGYPLPSEVQEIVPGTKFFEGFQNMNA